MYVAINNRTRMTQIKRITTDLKAQTNFSRSHALRGNAVKGALRRELSASYNTIYLCSATSRTKIIRA